MGWDRMGWDRMGWDRIGWDRMGWDGLGWVGMGICRMPLLVRLFLDLIRWILPSALAKSLILGSYPWDFVECPC